MRDEAPSEASADEPAAAALPPESFFDREVSWLAFARQPDGTYLRRRPAAGESPRAAQSVFIESTPVGPGHPAGLDIVSAGHYV